MSVDGEVGGWVDEVFAKDVALFHESVEVVPLGVDGDPAGMIARVGAVDGADEFDFRTCQVWSAMDPEFIRFQIGGVQVFFVLRVEDHAVNTRVGLVREVLDVLFESTSGGVVDGEY